MKPPSRYRNKVKYALYALLALFLVLNRGFQSLVRNSLEYRRLKKQKIELELRKEKLETELRAAREPGRVEEKARKELGMARAGEIEYRFAPAEPRE